MQLNPLLTRTSIFLAHLRSLRFIQCHFLHNELSIWGNALQSLHPYCSAWAGHIMESYPISFVAALLHCTLEASRIHVLSFFTQAPHTSSVTHNTLRVLIYSNFFVVQSLSCVWLFATPRTAAHQASLSFTISQSLLKLMSIESVMPSNHLVLCHPLVLLPSIFPSIRVFSNELALRIRWPKYWSSLIYHMQKEDSWIIAEASHSKEIVLEFEGWVVEFQGKRVRPVEALAILLSDMWERCGHSSTILPKQITHLLFLDLSPRRQAMTFNLIK